MGGIADYINFCKRRKVCSANTLLSVLNSRLDDINESLQKIWDNISGCKEKSDCNEVQNSYLLNSLVGAAEASMALRAARDIMAILISEEK